MISLLGSVNHKTLLSRNLVLRRYSTCRSCAKAGAFRPLFPIGDDPIVVSD